MIEVRAAATAATDLDDIDEIRFNGRLSSAGGSRLFSSDVEFGGLMSSQRGNSVPIRFSPGGHWIKAGATITPVFSRRASTITTARVATVTLVFLILPVTLKL
jgi:hypothetical protein